MLITTFLILQFEVTKKEVVEDQLLLWLSVEEFTAHVHAQKQVSR